MDHATAAKYRVILFGDQEDTNPIPPGLIALHDFAFKRLQRFGMGGVSREMAIYVTMLWGQTTEDGREFFAGTSATVSSANPFSAPGEKAARLAVRPKTPVASV